MNIKYSIGIVVVAISFLLLSSCTPESTELEPIQQSEGFHLTMSGTLSRSAQTDAVLNKMRLYSFSTTGSSVSGEGGSGQSPYSHPVAGVTRSGMLLSTKQMRTGNWDLVLVSDGGATLTPPIASGKAEELLMYTYNPSSDIDGTHTVAHEVWHRMKRLPTIVANGNHTDACGISRNMAMVRVVVERAVNVNTTATDHTVTLHHVPNRLSWAGTLLRTTSPGVYATSLSAPDTLSAPVSGKLSFRSATERDTFRSDTLTFVVPAHRENDFWATATTQNMAVKDTLTHKMALSVSFAKASGGYFTKHVQLPVVAKCNQVLLLKLRIDHFNIELTPTVLPWETQTVGGDAVAPYLNVSQISTTLYDGAASRVYFWSNQPAETIFVEKAGRLGSAALTNVDTQLDRLVGATAVNRHYDAATQSGYIDIANLNTAAGQQDMKIYLKAGALQREITVKRTASAQTLLNINTRYVGTFHRWNETGERVVTWLNTGAWTASIDDPSGTGADVLIDRQPSPALLNGSLYTTSPLNPELCKVSEGARSVTGTNRVYFRVGWRSNAPNPTQPRYATITVRSGSGIVIQKLYLRQGEEADYLMIPTDGYGNSPVDVSAPNWRPLAKKISPYNLTDPNMGAGGANLSDHNQLAVRGGSFTAYPTQAGAYFQWAGESAAAERRAYHPATPATGAITNWPTMYPTGFWDTLGATNETCPPGYRRFADGETNKGAEPTVANSEMLQSLHLSPVPTGEIPKDNIIEGFYADGYFDRRSIESPGDVSGRPNSSVSLSDKGVAYMGILFYNPNSKASLFVPNTGVRSHDGHTPLSGEFVHRGNSFYIWSASAVYANSGRTLYAIHGAIFFFHSDFDRLNGTSIRCVKE